MFGKKVDEGFLKLQNLREGFKGFFLEREEEVDGLLIALLSRNHILLIGPVGSAKSMMTETLCNCIMGVRYFYRLLTKFTIDKDLFVSEVNVLEQETNEGKMIRFHNISRGMLPDSHLIFLDEIFKCSATTLISLLQIMLTQTFTVNAGEILHSPIITLIGASNELSNAEDKLLPLEDRFLLRYKVNYITEPEKFLKMMADEINLPASTITLEELINLQAIVKRIEVPKSIFISINDIKMQLAEKGIIPSDRRFKNSLSVIKANAFLEGREYVEVNDLQILQHVLWTSESEIMEVRQTVLQTANPPLAKAVNFFEEAIEIYKEALQKDIRDRNQLGELLELELKLKELIQEMDNLPQTSTRIKTLRNKTNVFLRHLKQKEGIDHLFSEVDTLPLLSKELEHEVL